MRNVLYLFGLLSDDDVTWLARAGQVRELSPRMIMIESGSQLDSIFIVLKGHLDVQAGDRVVSRLHPGEIVGEMSMVDERPASATVVSSSMAQVLVISRVDLATRLSRDPGFGARFYRGVAMALSDRLRSVEGLASGRGDDDEIDEMNPELLDTMHMAGERFHRLLRELD